LTPHKTSQRWHRDATNPRAGAALQVMKPLSLSSLASPPIRRRWPQEWEEARIPRPAWTGTICCAGGTSHSSMGFILASYLVVLVSLFHRGHPPRQDRAYHAGPLPQTDCPTPAPGRASMCAKTRGSARRRWTRKPKEGNSLTHRHHRHQSTNRLNWGQNTRDGVLGPEDAADPTRGTRAQTPDEQRASRGCQVVAETESSRTRSGKSIFHARMLTMTAWRGTSAQRKWTLFYKAWQHRGVHQYQAVQRRCGEEAKQKSWTIVPPPRPSRNCCSAQSPGEQASRI